MPRTAEPTETMASNTASLLTRPKKKKLVMNLTDEAAHVVRELARRRGVTVSEVVRRAIALEKFIDDQLDDGSSFFVERKDGTLERVHFV